MKARDPILVFDFVDPVVGIEPLALPAWPGDDNAPKEARDAWAGYAAVQTLQIGLGSEFRELFDQRTFLYRLAWLFIADRGFREISNSIAYGHWFGPSENIPQIETNANDAQKLLMDIFHGNDDEAKKLLGLDLYGAWADWRGLISICGSRKAALKFMLVQAGGGLKACRRLGIELSVNEANFYRTKWTSDNPESLCWRFNMHFDVVLAKLRSKYGFGDKSAHGMN